MKVLTILAAFVSIFYSHNLCAQDSLAKQKPNIEEWSEGQMRLNILSSSLNEYGGFTYLTEELELVDSQKKGLRGILKEYFMNSRPVVSEYNSFVAGQDKGVETDPVKRKNKYNEEMCRLVKSAETKVNQLILPHQTTRLGQIAYQVNIANIHRVSGVYVLIPIVEEINTLDIKEKAFFLESARKSMKSFEDEVAALREKHEKEILDALPESVRHQIVEKIGGIVYDKPR